MLSLDYALRLYTDSLNTNQSPNITYYKENLTKFDYEEFLDLIDFVNIVRTIKETENFEKIFHEVDSYKQNYYGVNEDLKGVVNFKSESKDIDADTLSFINKLFDEEFDDESD